MAVADVVNVLLISGRDGWEERVRGVDPDRLKVASLPAAAFAESEADLWPPGRSGGTAADLDSDERDRLLREAHVILLGLPYPVHLYERAPNLAWVHHPNAGASNLWHSDLWGKPVTVTTSRGSNAALPIAESVIAGALMFARGLHAGARGSMSRRDYASAVTLSGKTMGVVGLGGIGGHVARLAKGLGMRVIATRRTIDAPAFDVDGCDEVFPADRLHELLSRSDFVAVCVMLTAETAGMFDAAAFAAMKPGAILVNVARGEVIDEAALIAALQAGRLGGVYLDVYSGELSGAPPPQALLDDPRVVITPHVSNAADDPGPLGIDLFLEYLRDFLDGRPLRNVIDWERGY